MSDRVAVFIDGSNAYHAFKASFGSGKYSPLKLARELAGPRPIVRVGFYIGAVRQEMGSDLYAQQQRFLAHLKQVPDLDVWTGRMTHTGQQWYEKGVDVKIATDLVAMAYAGKYDVAILVSGDSDLVPAVREVRFLGRVVENAMPSGRKSWHLFQESSKFVAIDAELFSRIGV
ncbi:MAG: NYN domain-containing protein [Thermoanaerobaculaceae bacterium]|nr:NYN domain-containing protein [Thermoanaerobaculaceae bacterium]MDI9622140.1 NYN domain-containing protein [Acidobacteriota bacterium]NLH11843.1 NYN domain-containing protein [Holophagae bacterium]HPW56138.1 NYN domain-containing protein [Thermoanaerobaculaceae bacterium]